MFIYNHQITFVSNGAWRQNANSRISTIVGVILGLIHYEAFPVVKPLYTYVEPNIVSLLASGFKVSLKHQIPFEISSFID